MTNVVSRTTLLWLAVALILNLGGCLLQTFHLKGEADLEVDRVEAEEALRKATEAVAEGALQRAAEAQHDLDQQD